MEDLPGRRHIGPDQELITGPREGLPVFFLTPCEVLSMVITVLT